MTHPDTNKNIYAYTEPTPKNGYPGFISINALANHNPPLIRVSVRDTQSSGYASEINLTPEQCEHLAVDLLTHLNGDDSFAAWAVSKQPRAVTHPDTYNPHAVVLGAL